MKKVAFFFFVLFAVSLVFSSCQKEVLEEALEKSEIIIKMALPDDAGQNGLKSASANQMIANGDTIDVNDLRNIHIVFSAEDQNGKDLHGLWHIFLTDYDNKTDELSLTLPPGYILERSNTASLRPSELGLYYISFQVSGKGFSFYLRNTGIPGKIGDDYRNDHAFRMEKVRILDLLDGGKEKTAYTLYLRIRPDEFGHYGEYNGINPVDPEYWQALLFCGGENFIETSYGGKLHAKNFRLRKTKYTLYDYVCFTFFPEDAPAIEAWDGTKYYKTQFYSGKYGMDWWNFSYAQKSDWNLSFGDAIQFAVL